MKPNLKKSRMHKIVSEMVFVDTDGNPVGPHGINVKKTTKHIAATGGKHSDIRKTKKAVVRMQRKASEINLSNKPVSLSDTEQDFRRHFTDLIKKQTKRQNTLAINYPMLTPLTPTAEPSSEGAPKVRKRTTPRVLRPGEPGPKPGEGKPAGRQPRGR